MYVHTYINICTYSLSGSICICIYIHMNRVELCDALVPLGGCEECLSDLEVTLNDEVEGSALRSIGKLFHSHFMEDIMRQV
jgi:hypothetical protein